MSADPLVVRVDPGGFDPHEIEQSTKRGQSDLRNLVPTIYQDAVVDRPEVRVWVEDLVARAQDTQGPCPGIFRGPSLLLLGPVGTGKTHAAWGALRALMVSGARCRWEFTTEAGFLMRMRPRSRVDTVEVFEQHAKTGVLVIDDLGASKDTEWAGEQNYQLFDYRCAWNKPTIITSNVLPKDLVGVLGERVASRLRSMCTTVSFKGPDRRAS